MQQALHHGGDDTDGTISLVSQRLLEAERELGMADRREVLAASASSALVVYLQVVAAFL
jgi:hypothetical protein